MYKKNQLYRFTVGAMFIIGGLLIGLSLFFLLYPSSEQSEREVPSKRKSTMDLKTGDRFPSSTTSRASEEENTSQDAKLNDAPSDQSPSTDTESSTEQLSPIQQSVTQEPPDRAQIVAKIQELEAESAAIREQYLGLIDMANELIGYGRWHNDNAGVLEQIHAVNDAEPGTDEAASERVRKKVMEITDKFNTEQQDIVDTINAVKEEADTLISQRTSILVEIKRLKASIGDK
jgi:hypothetical protein